MSDKSSPAVADSPKPFWQKNLLLEKPTRAFVALNIMDLVMTFFLLDHGGFRESNKIADYYLDRWGIVGMIWYKIIFVMLIVVIAQIVARKNVKTASWLLYFGCIAIGGVVIYSAYLYFAHGAAAIEETAMLMAGV